MKLLKTICIYTIVSLSFSRSVGRHQLFLFEEMDMIFVIFSAAQSLVVVSEEIPFVPCTFTPDCVTVWQLSCNTMEHSYCRHTCERCLTIVRSYYYDERKRTTC